MTAPTPPNGQAPGWRLAAALAAVLLAVVAWRSTQSREGSEALTQAPTAQTVSLTVHRPEADDEDFQVPWTAGQTVAEATRLATDTEWRGRGDMALLESLGGVGNRPAESLYWQFEVNGEYATRSAGAIELRQGDHVLWKLAPYE